MVGLMRASGVFHTYVYSKRNSSDLAERQIASADVILLNKTDIAPASEVEAIERIIHGINPVATLYKTVKAEIDLKYIVGIDAYTSSRPLAPTLPTRSMAHVHTHGQDDEPSHAHPIGPTHYELRGISSLQITFPTLSSSTLQRFDEWIRTVLWESHLPEDQPEKGSLEVLRCKGMFTEEGGRLYVLQGVRSMYEMTEVEKGGQEEVGLPDMGKLVLIGKGLDGTVRESLERVLKMQ